jgi:hypothetical protein
MSRKSLEERAVDAALAYIPNSTTLAPGPGFGPDPKPSSPKAALRRCCAAWQRAFNAYMDANKGDDIDKIFAATDAGEAYRNAMPMLAGYEGVRDFVACAAHGILIGAIPPAKSGQLLYAAQVALATLHLEPRTARIPPRQVAPTPTPVKQPTFDELFPLVTSSKQIS